MPATSTPSVVAARAAGQLAQLKAAAAALLGAAAAAPAAPVPQPPGQAAGASDADWEGRLAAVNAAVGAAPSPRQHQPGSPPAADANCCTSGTSLALHQEELIDAVTHGAGNCVTFLPLGLGLRPVVDAVLRRAVAESQGHVVVVVDRPAHALSQAQHLRSELGLPTAVFCGGDFLYAFQQQFQSSRVLVFTAGLLLRLLKTGVYHLSQASLLVLMDAFTAVRNHPSNTLVREYWRTTEEGARPRVVAVLASQLPSKPRPFDRLRQNLRKLCHSLQAELLLPHGCGLAQLEAQLHCDSIQLHSYVLAPPEQRLASLLQQHLLGLWDVLHEFGLNHFGRLVQFATAGSTAAAAAGGSGTPGTPAALGAAGGSGTPTSIAPLGAPGSGGRLLARGSPLSAGCSPAAEGSPSTPQQQGMLGAREGGSSGMSAAASAAEQPDPMQHDWAQVELQVVHSLWHSNALPNRGHHVREPDALALMMHVLDCVRALRLLLELGPAACMAQLPPALETLAAFLEEGIGGPPPFGGVVEPLKARILQVAASSPLLHWAVQPPPPPLPEPAEAPQQPLQEQPPGEPETPRAAGEQQQQEGKHLPPQLEGKQAAQQPAEQQQKEQAAGQAPAPSPLPSPQPSPQRRWPAGLLGKPGSAGGVVSDGPHAAATAGSSRAAALVQLLLELQVDAQLSGEPDRRRVALVAGTAESAAMLRRLLADSRQLDSAEVCLLRDAPEPPSWDGISDGSHAEAAAVAEAAEQRPCVACNGHAAKAAAAAEAEAVTDATVAVTAGRVKAAPAPSTGEAGASAEAAAEAAAGQEEEEAALPASAEASAAAAAGVRLGAGLAVHLLTVEELPELEQCIASYHSLVWYSSGDVLQASSQELESGALSACHQLSGAAAAAAAAARGDDGGAVSAVTPAASPQQSPRSGAGRLSCHVLATASQVLALGEVRRVDHSLKAAMQLVQLGDSAAEEKLTMLAHRGTAGVLEPEASTILEMLCCGLVGSAPAFATMMASPAKQPGRSRSSSAGDAGDADEALAPAPPALFQTSVTLPAAYFPPERFHISGVSMPLDVFVGPQLASEAAATNAASLAALMVLHRLGIVVRYWPSRLLLAQHLLPRSMDPLPEGPGGAPDGLSTGGVSMPAPLSVASGAPADSLGGAGGQQAAGGVPPHVMNFFCPLCNVAATGHKAFDAHLRGFRHQRRIKQAQLLQQGQEVSAMLQGMLLDEAPRAAAAGAVGMQAAGMPGSALPAVAIRRPDLALEDDGDYASGSPAFSDRQVYSPEPTPFRCDVCGVYCTSSRLLEAHTRGRKHQRRVAGINSPAGRPSSPTAQPLVTPYFCPTCGLYATSEEQLRMHMLGKRHTRMTQLHRQRGTPMAGVAAGLSAAVGGAPWPDAGAGGGFSMQQQHHQQLMSSAAAAAAAVNGGAGAAWVPSSSSGVRTTSGGGGSSSNATTGTLRTGSGVSTPVSGAAGGAAASGSSAGAGTWAEEAAAAALQDMLLDASGNQRIYRCDLCGVVTPSRRHYDYHLQGIKHTRRLLRSQGLDPVSTSQPGTPASCASPLAGSRSASPCARSARGRHSRHGSMDWAAGGGGGAVQEPAPESLICSVCGIMATSAINLEDHYKGRRHQKNVERQQAQHAAAAAAAAAVAAAAAGQLPPGAPAPRGPFDASAPFPAPGGGAPAGGSSLARSSSGITLGADGLRLSGGALLTAGSLPRLPSGDVFEGFPCVRIGDVLLPSSMDLRAFLEEMQHLEGEDEEEADLLPTISELHEHLTGLDDDEEGGGTAGPPSPHSTPMPPAPAPAQQPWAYGGSSTASPGSGTTSPAATGAGAAASWTSSSTSTSTAPGSQARLQPHAAPFHGHSRSQPSTPRPPHGAGGGNGRGSRPGSSGGGQRLSRFAQDQQAKQQQQQMAHQQMAHQQAQLDAAALGFVHVHGYTIQPAYGLMPAAYAAGYAPLHADYATQAATLAQQAAVMQQMAYGTIPLSPVPSYGQLSPVASYGALTPLVPLSPQQASAPPQQQHGFYSSPGSPMVLARMSPMPPPPSPSGRRPPRQQQQQRQ